MRLLISRDLPETVLAAAQARFDVRRPERDAPLDQAGAAWALAEHDAVICTLGDDFSAAAFAGAPRCKLLANFGVGYNHIDVEAAARAGVAVSNTPGAVTDATADLAMTLLLMACRRAGEGERLLRAGAWKGWAPMQLLGQHVSGKRVGILGMGRIGQAIARRCYFGFGMEIFYASRSPKSLDFPARRMADAAALAAAVDMLIVAVPGGAQTRNLVDGAVLAALGPQGFLVNIARGDVVDEAALIAALERGAIAGAGLDVYAREPLVPEALRAMEQVVLLPHLGTNALEVREAMGRMALENVIAMAEGRALPNPVTSRRVS